MAVSKLLSTTLSRQVMLCPLVIFMPPDSQFLKRSWLLYSTRFCSNRSPCAREPNTPSCPFRRNVFPRTTASVPKIVRPAAAFQAKVLFSILSRLALARTAPYWLRCVA